MSRRDFLKQLSLLTVASACAFKGGEMFGSRENKGASIPSSSANKPNERYEFDPYKGCKTSGFKFSIPLPFDFKLIDELVEINKKYSKSKVVNLYGGLPADMNPLTGFVTTERGGTNPKINSFEVFGQYARYAKNKGFNVVYLVNSAKPFSQADFDFFKPRLDDTLANLEKMGCNSIKIANPQLLEILKDKKDLNIQGSTSFEYTSIRQMQHLLGTYPRIKFFNLAIDTNRNIPLLKNLKKVFPKVEFELMVDEPCLYGCPARISHVSTYFSAYPCHLDNWTNLCRCNVIYPWNLDYYNSIGIKNFKLTGNTCALRANINSMDYVRNYFDAIEKGIEGLSVNDFAKLMGLFYILKEDKPITKEFLALLPDINYFINNAEKCAVDCGANCNYCMDCASNIEKMFGLA